MEWEGRFNMIVRDRLEDSAIAEAMKEAAREGAMMLSAGEPMVDLYPVEELRESFRKVLSGDLSSWGYSPNRSGVPQLQQWIAKWMGENGLLPSWSTPDKVFMTNGSQEGVSLISSCLLDPGDTVMVESPSYPDAFGVFRRDGVDLVGVELLPDGPDIEAMEELLARKRVKAFYTIPTYQNPTGYSTSDQKKRQVIELARRHDFVIFEDDPYRNISFETATNSTYIKAAGDDQRVIYLGSFSKMIAPALRVGWIIAPSPVVTVLEKLRIAGTLCMPDLIQYAIHELVTSCDLRGHLDKICRAYMLNCEAMADSLERHAGPEGLEIKVPRGGFFIWGRIPWISDTRDFSAFAIKDSKVAVVPGAHFYPEPGRGNDQVRFAFARVRPSMAEEGAIRFAQALRGYRDRQGREG
ncbi:MAG: Putative transcriptional regulator, GntR family [Synergistales bacterium 57_84]|nr:MAG: Putative transcriptional regulator, GntR family [Synergistales bacterium 57_84]